MNNGNNKKNIYGLKNKRKEEWNVVGEEKIKKKC